MPDEQLDETQIARRTKALGSLRNANVDPHEFQPDVDTLIDAAEELGRKIHEAGGYREGAAGGMGEAVRKAVADE